MDAAEFRRHGHALVEWIADYLEHADRYPVLARTQPGDIRSALPAEAPEDPESFGAIMADFERVLVPGLTHWNHPGFFAYFAISASPPGVLAEFLAAAVNQQAMLWRTSPAATELEDVALGWLRKLIGLPDTFEGVIYDTASVATLHALVAAREAAVPGARTHGIAGRADVPRLGVYVSDHANLSLDRAVIAIGLGQESLRRISVDDQYRMRVDDLRAAIASDRAAGIQPIAVVPTIGTTVTTSIDPVPAIAEICERERLWLHVDAAYGGVAAMLPSHRDVLAGCERADSLVVNPHKWLFTPFDLSAFYCRRMDVLRAAFSMTPAYLQTPERVSEGTPGTQGAAARASGDGPLEHSTKPEIRNLMDTGVQLGRRFRALKLWMILRSFGARQLRDHLGRHISLAQQFAEWVDHHPDFERMAPVPFSVVCFRWKPAGRTVTEAELDEANEKLVARVNQSGDVFLATARLDGRKVIRMAIGHLRTRDVHVRRAWELITSCTA